MIQETCSIIMNLKSEKFQIDVHRTVYVYVYCSYTDTYTDPFTVLSKLIKREARNIDANRTKTSIEW